MMTTTTTTTTIEEEEKKDKNVAISDLVVLSFKHATGSADAQSTSTSNFSFSGINLWFLFLEVGDAWRELQ